MLSFFFVAEENCSSYEKRQRTSYLMLELTQLRYVKVLSPPLFTQQIEQKPWLHAPFNDKQCI